MNERWELDSTVVNDGSSPGTNSAIGGTSPDDVALMITRSTFAEPSDYSDRLAITDINY